MEIKSAKKFSDEFYSLLDNNYASEDDLIKMFKEYAKQFIDLAAEKANTKHGYFSDGSTSQFRIVDKESILKVKQLIK